MMQFPSFSAEQFAQFAQNLAGLKMYPYLDAAHYIMMCIIVRNDAQQESGNEKPLSRRHPLASWVSSMLMCFAGSILSNALVGQMVLLPFKTHDDLILASAVWYVINYSPFDLAYKITTFFPGRIALTAAHQIYCVNKIDKGVSYALRNYSGSYAIASLIGIMKGAGHCYMRLLTRLSSGVWTKYLHELLLPSFASKASLAASVVFILESLKYIDAAHIVIYCGVVLTFIYFSVISSLGLGIRDPFVPIENIICAIFFGGLVDLLAKPLQRSGASPDEQQAGDELYDEPSGNKTSHKQGGHAQGGQGGHAQGGQGGHAQGKGKQTKKDLY